MYGSSRGWMTTLWLTLLGSTADNLAAAATDFDPDCPCIDVSQLFVDAGLFVQDKYVQVLQAEPGGDNCVAGAIIDYKMGRGMPNKTAFCHPSNYGSLTCQAWDAGYPLPHACGAIDAPSWCPLSWCYVDKDACRRSDKDVQGTLAFPALAGSLFFSYGTCGTATEDVLSYTTDQEPITDIGNGQVVAVGIPAMDYPMHYKRDANGSVVTGIGELYFDDSVPWEGSMIDFMNAVQSTSVFAGFNYTYSSNGARLTKPSSKWTAVVYDVGNHLLDMGGSDFWVTTERSSMTAFSTSFDIDLHYLWVPRPAGGDQRLRTRAARVFVPFSNELWLLILGAILLMSLFEVYIFRNQWREQGSDVEWEEAVGFRAKTKIVLSRWGVYLGRSMMHMTAGFPDEGSRSAQTMAWIGWSFFILITISAYTANLAAFMLRASHGSYIRSMSEAIEQGTRICAAVAVEDELRMRYPEATFVGISFTGSLSESWDQYGCEAVVWSMPVVKRSPSTAREMCTQNLVAIDIVLEMPWAFPSSHTLAPALSYWITRARSRGISYIGDYESDYYAETCADVEDMELRAQYGVRRRRLRSGGGRAAKAASAAGAGAAGGGTGSGLGQLGWTDIGTNVGANDLERLPADSFMGVIFVWLSFCGVALIRSSYDEYKEDGFTAKQKEERKKTRAALEEYEPSTKDLMRELSSLRTFVVDEIAAVREGSQSALQGTPPLNGQPKRPVVAAATSSTIDVDVVTMEPSSSRPRHKQRVHRA